jgi:hypothetical protein
MPDTDAREDVAGRLAWQVEWCQKLGSPLYAALLAHAADDARAGGPVWRALEGHEDDPVESMLQLRLMGAVHRLVLEGSAPDLARHYPSAGGDGDADAAWPAFRRLVSDRLDEVRALVERPVQTNEVGRSAALLGGLLLVAGATGLPLRLLEVGSSAGLNLRLDRFRYEAQSGAFGDPRSPVVVREAFAGRAPPLEAELGVAERAGCDPDPVDPVSRDGQLTLRSYVWPDQRQRLRLLDGALELAREVPAEVERAGAAGWLERTLREPAEGAATVVFHSIVMQYLTEGERERVLGLLEDAGRLADERAPLAHLAMEPGGEEAHVRLTTWPGGEERLIATAGYHGPPVRWLAG